jgi:hypothetical protein
VAVGEHRLSGVEEAANGRGANPWLSPAATKPLFTLCRSVAGLEPRLPT